METEITRERLHSVLDDSIENGADTLIIASKNNGKIHLIVGHFDTCDYEWLSTKITTELKIVGEVCGDIPECEYNYHDPVHPDVCHFECMLDANLEFNDRLTPKAQEYRDKLIVGVERMMKKVEEYKNVVE